MIVYKITNTFNGKLYFGITKCSLSKRWNEHKSKARSGKSHLNISIRKYGVSVFKIEKIYESSIESEIYEIEIDLIKKYKTNNSLFGYNNSIGGEISSKGKKLSNETKLKISNYQKTRLRKPHSNETKSKMREAALKNKSYLNLLKSKGHNKGKSAKNKRAVILNDTYIYNSVTDAAKQTGVIISSISNNINGRSKKTKIGIWKNY